VPSRQNEWSNVVRQMRPGVLASMIAMVGMGLFAHPATTDPAVAGPVHRGESSGGGEGAVLGVGTGSTEASGAIARARRVGRPVFVAGASTETTTVRANPSGTFTAELSVDPVRVKRAGRWRGVDTNLVAGADGRLRPAATDSDVTFSGGRDDVMVRSVERGVRVELQWREALPRPSVDGATATYREVLPGVDLQLTATPRGFSKVLVVKDRRAAANPELRRVLFGFSVRGGRVASDAHGNFSIRKGTRQVFAAGAPLMWDSSSPRRYALGRADARRGSLTVVPDRAMLTSPDTTFPLHIDPDFRAGQTGFAMVFSGKPNNAYWGGDADNVAKVGRCYDDGWCNGIGTARSYFQFDTRALLGKQILGAELNVFGNHAATCTPSVLEVWQTGTIGSGLTWNNQPAGFRITSASTSFGRAACPDKWVGFNATTLVRNRVVGDRSPVVTAMVRAGNEGDQLAWKKLNEGATLTVEYNSIPAKPTSMSIEGRGCHQSPNEPHVNPYVANDPELGPRGPQLSARVTDPDGQPVKIHFEWANWSGTKIGAVTTGTKSSGSTFAVDVPAAHALDGARLAVRATATDNTHWSGWTSPWCHVVIDRTAPLEAPDVSSETYPECTPTSCPWAGGVDRPGTFAFAPRTETHVAGYYYGLHDQPDTFVAVGEDARATITLAPTEDGPVTLFARTVDKAGNAGPLRHYRFFVAPSGTRQR
jgi:hypothetical protein